MIRIRLDGNWIATARHQDILGQFFFSAFAPRPAASLAEPTQNCQKSLLTKGGVPPVSWFIRLYKTHLTSVKVGYIYYKPTDLSQLTIVDLRNYTNLD